MAELHRALDSVERRVLGCLIEKELSTPDGYPLSGNSLVAACNQSSNRDPVTSLDPESIDAALHTLMGDLLVWRERGARVLRWKHLVDEKLGLDVPARAVLAELLLRGSQTPGELRGRCHRMHAFEGVGEVEGVLMELAARRLVEELPRAPGQKERRWRQKLGDPPPGGAGAAGAGAARAPGEPGAPEHGDAGAAPAPRGEPLGERRLFHPVPAAQPAPPPPRGVAVAPTGAPSGAAAAAATATAGAVPSAATLAALERRVTALEGRLAEALARIARLEQGGG